MKNDIKKNSYEYNINRLKEIVELLESKDIQLDKGMQLYKEGISCSNYCKNYLKKVKHQIEILNKNGSDYKELSVSDDE
ncbi:MAG: exodeoxyribonuclease VII small subunit [Desulfovibrio sp.]|nr:exodeoxyribonuclease VII small subunit [Desulfovibrio sp.]